MKFEKLTAKQDGESSRSIQSRVQSARDLQTERFATMKIHCNAEMKVNEIKRFCEIDRTSEDLLKTAMLQFNLSARGFHRILKVARTISDLAEEKSIRTNHVAEALQYRPKFWGLKIMRKILPLVKISAKKSFQLLQAKTPLLCNALQTQIQVTKLFFYHIALARNRTTRDLIQRLLTIPLLQDILSKGKLVETRIAGRKEYFKICWIKDEYIFSIIILRKRKEFFLLSCFVD